MEEQLEKVAKAIENFTKEIGKMNATFKPYLEWYKGYQIDQKKSPIQEIQHNQACPFCIIYGEEVRPCLECERVQEVGLSSSLKPPAKDKFKYNENWKERQGVKS